MNSPEPKPEREQIVFKHRALGPSSIEAFVSPPERPVLKRFVLGIFGCRLIGALAAHNGVAPVSSQPKP